MSITNCRKNDERYPYERQVSSFFGGALGDQRIGDERLNNPFVEFLGFAYKDVNGWVLIDTDPVEFIDDVSGQIE